MFSYMPRFNPQVLNMLTYTPCHKLWNPYALWMVTQFFN